MRRDARVKSVAILPVRMSPTLYADLAFLAEREETTRCSLIAVIGGIAVRSRNGLAIRACCSVLPSTRRSSASI